MKVLVVGGRATVELDQVREGTLFNVEGDQSVSHSYWRHEIDNIFKGRLGIMVAKDFAARGFETTLLIAKDSLHLAVFDSAINVRSFRTFGDLERELTSLLKHERWDVVIMSAAPPDYSPVKIDGKMPSEANEISITYLKNPKLLDTIRPLVGADCLIVGFKLLVGTSSEILEEVGRKQISRADTDICVGNDLSRIDTKEGIHPLQLIFKDRPSLHFEGKKTATVAALVEEIVSALK